MSEATTETRTEIETARPATAAGPNLESIMHIPLQVSVELGRVQLPLHAVARLGRGAVVDLQKEAGAPVEICANGRAFARGEIVSADGKLGVRILEILPAGERIQTLA